MCSLRLTSASLPQLGSGARRPQRWTVGTKEAQLTAIHGDEPGLRGAWMCLERGQAIGIRRTSVTSMVYSKISQTVIFLLVSSRSSYRNGFFLSTGKTERLFSPSF